MGTINWTKVREAVRALAGLTADESEATFNLLASINEARDTATKPEPTPAPTPEPTVPPERPACRVCGKTFKSAKGVAVHAGHMHTAKQLNLKGVK